LFYQKKPDYNRYRITKSVGILAAFLMLIPLLEIHTPDIAFSSISSSSMYDNIMKNFDNLLPFKVPQIDKEQKTDTQREDEAESQSAQLAATTDPSCRESLFYDNFNSLYSLHDGQTSPNGKWKNVYSGYGSTGVKLTNDGKSAFWLSPKAATSPSETHAAEVQSTSKFCNFSMKVDMNTVKPLRKNSPANTWEVGWLFFRYVDDHHHYYFLVKPNGIELGKKDCNICKDPIDGDQVYLVTKTFPTLKMNTWNKVQVDMIGNNIKVYWNGNLVINYTDKTMSSKLASGKIAMYSEDAYVLYDNMYVYPK
jgi:hypothetical protein